MSKFDDLLGYWRSLPCEAGCEIPRKSAFKPADIKKLLPFITIHERMGRYDMRGRLTGTAIDEMFRTNYTGVNLFDIYSQRDHEFFAGLHDNMLGRPCGSRSQRRILMPNGERYTIESIHLPLADDNGKPVYLLTLMGPKPEYSSSESVPGRERMATLEKAIEYLDLGFGVPPTG